MAWPVRLTGATLDSEFKINREDFGMSYGKGKIDDEVGLAVEVKAKAAK